MRAISWLCLLMAALVLPACGGGDDSSDEYSGDSVPSDADPANFEKVQAGMTKEQVETLIGPAYTYLTQETGTIGMWNKPDGTKFSLFFDISNTVVSVNAPPAGMEYE